eukprot:7336918-Pyramimonas_sp.AAC.1
MAWGNRRGSTSSGSAFMRNAMAEMSKFLGEHSLAVMDMWKCFDTAKVKVLFQEARGAGFPSRLLRQLVTSYKCPARSKPLGPSLFYA